MAPNGQCSVTCGDGIETYERKCKSPVDGRTLDHSACRNDTDNSPEFDKRGCHKDVCRELFILFYVYLIT